jgi:hypothetical protein
MLNNIAHLPPFPRRNRCFLRQAQQQAELSKLTAQRASRSLTAENASTVWRSLLSTRLKGSERRRFLQPVATYNAGAGFQFRASPNRESCSAISSSWLRRVQSGYVENPTTDHLAYQAWETDSASGTRTIQLSFIDCWVKAIHLRSCRAARRCLAIHEIQAQR